MLVVDAMRVPYIDRSGTAVATDAAGNPYMKGTFNPVFSVQRYQPYRGGHAVPARRRLREASPRLPHPRRSILAMDTANRSYHQPRIPSTP